MAEIMRSIRLLVILLGVFAYTDSWAAAIGVIKPKTDETVVKPPQTSVPATTAPAEPVKKAPDKSVRVTPDKNKQAAAAKGMSSKAILIGAGVAAALAAIGGGGGGGGSSSTPQH